MLLASKISAAILLAALRLLAGLLPLKVYRKLDKWGRQPQEDGNKVTGAISGRQTKIDLLLSVFLCFGAGLLFSTCFVHMIPEVRESFDKAARSGHWTNLDAFPFAEAIVCLGFFAVYLLEEIGHKLMSSSRRTGSADKSRPSLQQTGPDEQKNRYRMSPQSGGLNMAVESDEPRTRSSSLHSDADDSDRGHGHSHQAHGHSHGPLPANLDQSKSVTAAIRGFLLVFALSFHSVFEGMAIGLQPSLKDVWFLFAAVTVHELAIMFCIGLEMLASHLRTVVYVAYMVTLGLITPIGVAIGIIITEYVSDPSPGHTLAIAVLQGIAAGTLLYVTFLEVLERERAKEQVDGLIKFAAFFLGFVLLSLLEALGHGGGDHDHDHSAHSSHVDLVLQPTTTTQYSYYTP